MSDLYKRGQQNFSTVTKNKYTTEMCLSYLWVVYTLIICGALGEKSTIQTYTGYRLDPSSKLDIYYFDMVIAITETSKDNKLINCEFVDIEEDNLREELMKNLKSTNKPVLLDIDQMLNKMDECNQLDQRLVTPEVVCRATHGVNCKEKNPESNPMKKLKNKFKKMTSGVTPGTKYCGKGKLATMYCDLGSNIDLDMCCRLHDYCPSVLKPGATRYGLNNNSKYTRSHCKCDKKFKTCLKKCKGINEDIIGAIFFNLVENKCFDEINGKTEFVSAESY